MKELCHSLLNKIHGGIVKIDSYGYSGVEITVTNQSVFEFYDKFEFRSDSIVDLHTHALLFDSFFLDRRSFFYGDSLFMITPIYGGHTYTII